MDDLLRQIQRLQVREIEVSQEKTRQDKIFLGKIAELERDVLFFRRRTAELEEKFRLVSQREGESDDIRNRLEAKVTDEIGRMASEIERLRRLLTTAGEDYSRLARSHDDLESKHRTAVSQLEVMSRTVQQKDGEVRAMTSNIEEKRELWVQEERQRAWDQIRQVNTSKSNEILQMVTKKESELVAQAEKHNAEVIALRHEQTVALARLHEENRRVREQNEMLAQSLEVCRVKGDKELQNFKRQLEAKQWELEKSAGEMTAIVVRIESLEREHQGLVASNSDATERLKASNAKLQAAELQLADAQRWSSHLNEEVTRMEEASNRNGNPADLRKELAEITARFQKVSNEKNLLNDKVAALERELELTKLQAKKLSDTFKAFNDRRDWEDQKLFKFDVSNAPKTKEDDDPFPGPNRRSVSPELRKKGHSGVDNDLSGSDIEDLRGRLFHAPSF